MFLPRTIKLENFLFGVTIYLIVCMLVDSSTIQAISQFISSLTLCRITASWLSEYIIIIFLLASKNSHYKWLQTFCITHYIFTYQLVIAAILGPTVGLSNTALLDSNFFTYLCTEPCQGHHQYKSLTMLATVLAARLAAVK